MTDVLWVVLECLSVICKYVQFITQARVTKHKCLYYFPNNISVEGITELYNLREVMREVIRKHIGLSGVAEPGPTWALTRALTRASALASKMIKARDLFSLTIPLSTNSIFNALLHQYVDDNDVYKCIK